jgi:TIR domain
MAGGDSGPGRGPGRQWDVVLSFAGAQRGYVKQVAGALRARGVRCFYDAGEEIELWGKPLAEELPAVYGERAAAVVLFISAEYAARDWTRLERQSALGRAVRERREYVLPARFDDTPLPGLLPDIVVVDLRDRTPQQFAAMIAAKLAALGIIGPTPDEQGLAGETAPERDSQADVIPLRGKSAQNRVIPSKARSWTNLAEVLRQVSLNGQDWIALFAASRPLQAELEAEHLMEPGIPESVPHLAAKLRDLLMIITDSSTPADQFSARLAEAQRAKSYLLRLLAPRSG